MEGLLAICDAEGVKVSYQPLAPDRGLLGMYIREGRRAGIILDESLSSQPRLERTVMAEEVGHHFTVGHGNIFVVRFSHQVATVLSRDEYRALRWAANYLIPTDDLVRAIQRGYTSLDELADYFYVTSWMVQRKLCFLRLDFQRDIGYLVDGSNHFSAISAVEYPREHTLA